MAAAHQAPIERVLHRISPEASHSTSEKHQTCIKPSGSNVGTLTYQAPSRKPCVFSKSSFATPWISGSVSGTPAGRHGQPNTYDVIVDSVNTPFGRTNVAAYYRANVQEQLSKIEVQRIWQRHVVNAAKNHE